MTDSDPSRHLGRRSREVAERTRSDVVRAARELFAERGFDLVSTRDIAAKAGVTHGLIRHHFGSKAGIWEAVVDEIDSAFSADLQPLLEELQGLDTAQMDRAAFAERFFRKLVEACGRNREVGRLIFLEGASPSGRLDHLLGRLRHARDAVEGVVRALGLRGPTATAPDSFFLALLILATVPFALPALCEGLVEEPLGPEDQARRLTQLLLTQAGQGPLLRRP